MQTDRERCSFGGLGHAAEVFAGELGKCELALAAHLPQEIRVELRSEGLRICKQCRGRGVGKAQQDVRGLDLEPLAGRGLDLQRGIVIGEDGAGLERAVVLEKDVHGERGARPVLKQRRL